MCTFVSSLVLDLTSVWHTYNYISPLDVAAGDFKGKYRKKFGPCTNDHKLDWPSFG